MHDDLDDHFRENLVATPSPPSPISTPDPEPQRVQIDDGKVSDWQNTESNDESYPTNPSVPLQRSGYIVFFTLLYGAAALYSWVIICILTHRPIGAHGYGHDELDNVVTDRLFGDDVEVYLDSLFSKTKQYLRAARIVQSLVSVLTLPLTPAVCSQAAVVYIQRRRGGGRPTLRQSMALADKGWTDLVVLKNLVVGGWKKYKSSLLLFAMFLHLLGEFKICLVRDLIYAAYLSSSQYRSYYISSPADLPIIHDNQASPRVSRSSHLHRRFPWFFPGALPESGRGIGIDATKLRATLSSTVNTVVQPRLWSISNATVSFDETLKGIYSPFQTKSQNTLANISSIPDPFWAELPSSTNTGLVQQFALRINSTAVWEDNPSATLPDDCNFSSDAFYLRYEYEYDGEEEIDDPLQYTVDICMPGNISVSPWNNQSPRQDFSEELYFKMNFSGKPWGMVEHTAIPGTYWRKLTLHTTTGYFELPNYANGQVPGPLLGESPFGKSASDFATGI